MIWNSLPEHIRNSSALTIFRKQLKTHLFPLKITCTATDWFTGFLFGSILIIVGCSIVLRLVVSVWWCVLTMTSLMLLLWSKTDGNVLILLLISAPLRSNGADCVLLLFIFRSFFIGKDAYVFAVSVCPWAIFSRTMRHTEPKCLASPTSYAHASNRSDHNSTRPEIVLYIFLWTRPAECKWQHLWPVNENRNTLLGIIKTSHWKCGK